MTDKRMLQPDRDNHLPLDEKHWDALVFPGTVTLQILLYEGRDSADELRSDDRVTLGTPGRPVTVRDLVEGVQAALQAKFGDMESIGYYDGMLLSREACCHDMKLCILLY